MTLAPIAAEILQCALAVALALTLAVTVGLELEDTHNHD